MKKIILGIITIFILNGCSATMNQWEPVNSAAIQQEITNE